MPFSSVFHVIKIPSKLPKKYICFEIHLNFPTTKAIEIKKHAMYQFLIFITCHSLSVFYIFISIRFVPNIRSVNIQIISTDCLGTIKLFIVISSKHSEKKNTLLVNELNK